MLQSYWSNALQHQQMKRFKNMINMTNMSINEAINKMTMNLICSDSMDKVNISDTKK